MLVPAIVGIVLFVALPDASATVRGVLSIVAALVVVGWALLIWYLLAERAAGPGMRAMRIQLVGFYDGRPIGWVRVLLRAVIFWALFATGIGLVLLLVFLVLHPRKQGWHDLAVKAVVIKERILAPAAPRAGVAQHVTTHRSSSAAAVRPGPPATPRCLAASPRRPRSLHRRARATRRPVTPPSATRRAPTVPPGRFRLAADPQPPVQPYAPVSGRSTRGRAPVPGSPYWPPRPRSARLVRGRTALQTLRFPSLRPRLGAVPADRGVRCPRSGVSAQDLDWHAVLDDGRRLIVDRLVLLGRNPQPEPGEEDAQLIKIADETRTVSKLHLALGVDQAGLYVVDRGSTNGSTVTTPGGATRRCAPGEVVYVSAGVDRVDGRPLAGDRRRRSHSALGCAASDAGSSVRSAPPSSTRARPIRFAHAAVGSRHPGRGRRRTGSGWSRTRPTWCSRRASTSGSTATSGSSRTTATRTSTRRWSSPT